MSVTGFNLRRRKVAEAKKEPVISEKVVEVKEEPKKETADTSTTKVVHKKTTKK